MAIALRTFREGNRVKAIILSRNLDKKQLSLSVKPSYFSEDEVTEIKDNVEMQGDASPASDTEEEDEEYDRSLFDESDEETNEEASEDDSEVGDYQLNTIVTDLPPSPTPNPPTQDTVSMTQTSQARKVSVVLQ